MKLTLCQPNAKAPTRAHAGDAGLDLYAAHDATINAGETSLVGTGIAIQLDPGTVG